VSGSILVAGSLHWDVVVSAPHLPVPDETVLGSAVAYQFGGKGGNQALAAARHGAPVHFAGCIGTDDFSKNIRDRLQGTGINLDGLQRVDGPAGMSVAVVDASGTYGAVVVSAANLSMDPTLIALPTDCRMVMLQNEIRPEVSCAVSEMAKAAGATIMVNAAPARADAAPLLELADILIVNRVEADEITGGQCQREGGARSAVAALHRPGRTVVLTRGAEGVTVGAPDGTIWQAAAFKVDTVSTHGAGDMFCGALGARLLAGDKLTHAVAYSQAAAALHVSKDPAARETMTPDDVMSFLARHSL